MIRICRMQWLVLLVALAGNVSLGQDVDEEEEEFEALVRIQPAFEIGIENFDQWVFGNSRNAKGGRARMKSQLKLKVEAVDRACQLTDAQKKKIELAGRGDIKRFYNDVASVRAKFIVVRRDQKKFNRIWADIQPLQVRLQAGIFDEQSLAHKVIKRSLNSKQTKRYASEELKRRRFHYQAIIGRAIATLEDGMPLRDEQRVRLSKLLVDETETPLKFGHNDFNVVMFRASKIPEEKMRPIFDGAQWRALKNQLDRVERLERHLRKNGVI